MTWFSTLILDWVLPFLGVGLPVVIAAVAVAAAIYLRLPIWVYFAVAIGLGAYGSGWFLSGSLGDAKVLRLEKVATERTIADQAVTIDAFRSAAAKTAALDLAESQRAAFAQSSIDALQKEADDAAALSLANALHRPDVCNLTDPELDGLRKRLPQ